jgi:hypothetical protein
MTRVLEKAHLEAMIQALRMAFKPGRLLFEITDESVLITFTKNDKPILRALRKSGRLWIISHDASLFS